MFAYKKVLCPIDFSEASYKALKVAYDFTAYYHAQLILIHVVSFPAPNSMGYPTEREAENFAMHEAHRGLQQAIQEYLPADVNVLPLVRVGDAAVEIEQAADEENVDVIVMATHGLTGWRRLVYGSITQAVLHSVICPVLTVSAASENDSQIEEFSASDRQSSPTGTGYDSPLKASLSKLLFSRILCATDLSEFSYQALDMAAELALDFAAELHIVHVMEPLDPALGIVSDEEFELSRINEIKEEIKQVIDSRVDKDVRYRITVKSGCAAPEILKVAIEEKSDVITIATHGLSGWKRLVFGSVAEQILHSTQKLVLVISARPTSPVETRGQ